MEIKTTEVLANECFETNFKQLKKDERKWVAVDDFKQHIITLESYATSGSNEQHSYPDLLDMIAEHTGKILEEIENSEKVRNKKEANGNGKGNY